MGEREHRQRRRPAPHEHRPDAARAHSFQISAERPQHEASSPNEVRSGIDARQALAPMARPTASGCQSRCRRAEAGRDQRAGSADHQGPQRRMGERQPGSEHALAGPVLRGVSSGRRRPPLHAQSQRASSGSPPTERPLEGSGEQWLPAGVAMSETRLGPTAAMPTASSQRSTRRGSLRRGQPAGGVERGEHDEQHQNHGRARPRASDRLVAAPEQPRQP